MRYPSIDILRTIAIALMVLVHFVENLSGAEGLMPTGFAAPIFTFLSGVSYRLWLNGQEKRGKTDSDIGKVTIRRGLFLFGVGFLFNIVVWMPEDTFNWDILTFIGTALILLNIVRKMPAPIALLICALVFLISPLLRAEFAYTEYWVHGYFDGDLTLSDVTLGFFVLGYFPIFPWIIYPVVGFTVASWLFPEARRSPQALSRLTIAGFGLLAACGAALLLRAHSPTLVQEIFLKGWTMFPASTAYLLGTLGGAITAFSLAHRWIDQNPRFAQDGLITRVASTFSKHSFSVYLLHHVVHLWPLWIYGLANDQEPTYYWREAMPVAWAWPLACLFLFLCYFFLRWMDRTGKSGVESLMRWLCD